MLISADIAVPFCEMFPHIQPSCPDLIRASIILHESLSKKMDCRVKPGNDGWARDEKNKLICPSGTISGFPDFLSSPLRKIFRFSEDANQCISAAFRSTEGRSRDRHERGTDAMGRRRR